MKKTVILTAAFAVLLALVGCQAPALNELSTLEACELNGSRDNEVIQKVPTDVVDSYEEDDDPSIATYVLPTGGIMEYNFFDDSKDWIKFMAYAGKSYRIRTQTYGDSDTILYLYKSDVASGTNPIAENDDIGPQALSSKIEWTCEMSDIYYIKVQSYKYKIGANRRYTLTISEIDRPLALKEAVNAAAEAESFRTVAGTLPTDIVDRYEEDDDPSCAFYVEPTGGNMEHNFFDDSKDWVKFMAYAGKSYTITTRTYGESDTILYLYDSEVASGSKALAVNDDVGPQALFSRIDWTCTKSDIYYIKVQSYGYKTGTNRRYTLSVQEK